MQQYLKDLEHIMLRGDRRPDRTGTGTLSVFGLQTRYDLRAGFPAMTTKKLAWNAVVSELLWFIEGSADERRLAEILHGTRDPFKTTIWTDNAHADYWEPKARFSGDLGRVYGVQWRSWNRYIWNSQSNTFETQKVDQINELIAGIKKDPHGRRHILSAWNVADLDEMALPPCHVMSQFYVNSKRELSCQMYQRSADFFLGAPFNIASYALLTHMIAQVCGLGVGEFIHTIGDAHLYVTHLSAAKEQLSRTPKPLPTLYIDESIKNISDFRMDSFRLQEYNHHPAIRAPMSV